MVGPIVNATIQSTVIVFDVRFLSTNLTNITLRTGYAINDLRAIYGLRCRFLND